MTPDFPTNPANVKRLGRWLVEQGFSAAELQAFYERPWRYGDEYLQMIESEREQSDRKQEA